MPKFLYSITKSIIGLIICLNFLPTFGFGMLELGIEKTELQVATTCDFEAKLLIERSPKCGNLGGIVSVWVTENQEPVTYFWKADGGEMFSTGTVNTLENVPADITHWAIIRDASGCEVMLDFELAEQPCICPLTARAVINKYPECGGADGSVRIDYSGDQGDVTFSWGPAAQRNDLLAGKHTVTVTDELDCEFIVEFELTEGTCCEDYAATAVVNKLPDCGESNGSVTINVVGQTGVITYKWGNNSSWGTEHRMDNLAAGEYWVRVRDEAGCEVTVHFEIAGEINGESCCVDSDLMATATIYQAPECGKTNGSAEIIVTGGVAPYTYSWGEKARFDNLIPGKYLVTVTDAYDCTAEVEFLLTREDCCNDSDLTATVTINQQPECGKTNGSVTINAAGGAAPYTYSWGELSRFDNLIPGNYLVTVTDAFGCTAMVDFVLLQEDCCKDSDLMVTPIINQHPDCGKNNGSVNLVVTGGVAPYAYSWGGLSRFDNLIPGNYSVMVTDAFNCSTVVDFELIEGPCCTSFAIELAIQDPTNCDQNDGAVDFIIMGTTGNLTYTWDDGLVTKDSFRTNLADRTYEVTITDDFIDCQQIVRLPLKTFAPCPPPTCFTTTVEILKQPDCEVSNGEVEIIVTGSTNGLRYIWEDSTFTTRFRDNLAAGDYMVIIAEDSSDCRDTVNFRLVSPAPCPPPPPCFTASVEILKQPDCEVSNGEVEIIVTGSTNGLRYIWEDSTFTTRFRDNLAAGDYVVIIAGDSLDCRDTVNFRLVSPAPCPPPPPCFMATVEILKQPDCEVANGEVELVVTGSTNGLRYIWEDSTFTTRFRDNLAAGDYMVIIAEDSSDCRDTVNFRLVSPAPCPPLLPCFMTTVEILKQPDCEMSNGEVELIVTGSTNGLRYIWEDSTFTTRFRDNLAAGDYVVIIAEDSSDCRDTVTFRLVSPAPCPPLLPCFMTTVEILKQPDCEVSNGLVEIVATGSTNGLQYIWEDSTFTTRFRDNLAAGDYVVIIAGDSLDCRDTVNFRLVSPAPCPPLLPCFMTTVEILKQPDCEVSNGEVELVVTGSTNGLRYIWEDSTFTTRFRDNLAAGDYVVIIAEDSSICKDTITFSLVSPAPCPPPPPCFTTAVRILKQPDCEVSNGLVEIVATGSTNGLRYIWADGTFITGFRGNLAAGDYVVIIAEATSDCRDTLTFSLVSPAPCPPSPTCFTASVEIIKQPDCDISNGTVAIIAMGATTDLTYIWEDTTLTDSVRTDLVAGDYTVIIVEDSMDCRDTLTFSLVCPPPPPCFTASVEVIKQPNCDISDGTVAIIAMGATTELTYIWEDTTLTDSVRTDLVAGDYTVIIVEDSTDCRDTLTFSLVCPPPPPCFTASVEIIKQPDCDISNGTVAIIAMGATAGLTYIWEDITLADAVRTDLVARDYKVIIVEDSTDCKDTLMFTLDSLTAELQIFPDTLCSDTTIGGLGYELKGCFVRPIDIQIFNERDSLVATVENDTLGAGRIEALLPNQEYMFIARDGNREVVDSQMFRVVIPIKPSYDLFRDTVLCNDTATVDIGIALSEATPFSWLPNPNIADTLRKESTLKVPIGTYYINLFNGCPVMDSVVIRDGRVLVEFSNPDPLCMVGTTTLNVINLDPTQTLSYDWLSKEFITLPTDTTDLPIVTVSETTQFNVTINNQFGCELVDSVTVIVADTNLLANIRVLPNMEKIPAGGTSELTLSETLPNGFTLEWQADPTLEEVGETAIVTPTINGTQYFANIFSEVAPQCAVSRDTAVWIGCDDDAIFMPNAFSPNGDGINDILYVRGVDGFLSMNLIIYNRWGEKVFETSDADYGWDGRFKGKELGPDVYGYYLTVTCPSDVITLKGNVTLLK